MGMVFVAFPSSANAPVAAASQELSGNARLVVESTV